MIPSLYGKEHSVKVGDRAYCVSIINDQLTLCGFEIVNVERRESKDGRRLLPVITLRGINVTFGKEHSETKQVRKLSLYYATAKDAIRAEYALLLCCHGISRENDYSGDINDLGILAKRLTELSRIYNNCEDIVKGWK